MADPNISQILAALATQRPDSNPPASQIPPQQPPMGQPYQAAYPTPPPVASSTYALPQPTSSGSVDLSNVKPSGSGSVSLAEAVARARGIAAERGVDSRAGYGSRDGRRGGRRSRSRSRSPPRGGAARDLRDSYNPYREERRNSSYRDRSFSPGAGGGGASSGRPALPDRYGNASSVPPGGGGAGEPGAETITIESHLVGLIIGRAGENLRRVESETGARVQFLTGPEATGAHRPCKISGARDAREHAKREIARIVQENGKTSQVMTNLAPPARAPPAGGGGGPGGPGGSAPRDARPGEESTQMMVPNRTVGLIIGRGGETIRDLQERSGCHVNIVGEDKSVQGLRPVNLVGSLAQTAQAKALIMEIVDSDSKSQAAAQQHQYQQGGGAPGRPVMTSTGRSDMIGERINDNIKVPSEAVGMIIGKGGETIKEMQNISGCKINVSQPSGDDIERDIGLVGTREAIEAAKMAIMDKVRAVEEKNGGGGRGGGRGGPPYQQDTYGRGPPQNQSYGQSGGGDYNQSYNQYTQQQPGAAAPQQQQQPSAQAADPYAAYGGYENYMALWYSHMQSQGQSQQQQPQG